MKRYPALAVIPLVVIGVGLSIAASWSFRRQDERAALEALKSDIRERTFALERALELNLSVVRSLRDLHTIREPLRREFATFAGRALERRPGVRALEWVPRVPNSARELYERTARSDGLDGFRFTDRADDGTMVPAASRAEYFPVYFVEPRAGNEPALGFDLGSQPERRRAIETARDSGAICATGAVHLVQERWQRESFLVFAPVYLGDANDVEQRRHRLRGLALGVFDLAAIVEPALRMGGGQPAGILIRLTDETDGEVRELYRSGSGGGDRVEKAAQRFELGFADRRWALTAVPHESYLAARGTWLPQAALLVGLILTGAAAIYVVAVDTRARAIETTVAARTRDLVEVRELAAHLQSAREEERTRVAREIHDELGQTLTGLKLELSYISRRTREDDLELRDRLEDMGHLIDETIGSVRRIATELRPEILDNLGLIDAIRWQAAEFEKRTRTPCMVTLPDDEVDCGRERATALFRILQEALTNIVRHAEATEVQVYLARDSGRLLLEITDNGRGIAADQPAGRGSFGLRGMEERAHEFGGTLRITTAPSRGTTVSVTLPY
jgi:signal transduction histidine kinase